MIQEIYDVSKQLYIFVMNNKASPPYTNTSNKRGYLRFQVLTAASMMFRAVFWVVLPCKMIVDHFTRQYNPEDSSEQAWLSLPIPPQFKERLS
jgi:hypothetical protein